MQRERKAVMLGVSTQIEIVSMIEEGLGYQEIDKILNVPEGSSEYTIRRIREKERAKG